MKKVYICSPYRAKDEAELDRHIEYAQELTRNALVMGLAPITPHLYMTQCLDESKPEARALGMAAGLELLKDCAFVIVGTKYGISEGMEREINTAQRLGIQTINSPYVARKLELDKEAEALEYAKRHTCDFCRCSGIHSCTGYDCKEPYEKAYQYAKTILDSGQPLP